MRLREQEYQSRRRDYAALERLDRRLLQADQDRRIRDEILSELDFLPEDTGWFPTRWLRRIEYWLRVYWLAIVPVLVGVLLLDVIFAMFGWHEFRIPPIIPTLLAAIVAYQSWRMSRLNSTVDDALKRKDMTNALITNNAELLLPYVQSALLASPSVREPESDVILDTKVEMYIYGELDNLEFVFYKSKHSLIDEFFVIRAINIFISRGENRLFRLKARALLDKGRYSHDLRQAAETLLLVGEWRQTH